MGPGRKLPASPWQLRCTQAFAASEGGKGIIDSFHGKRTSESRVHTLFWFWCVLVGLLLLFCPLFFYVLYLLAAGSAVTVSVLGCTGRSKFCFSLDVVHCTFCCFSSACFAIFRARPSANVNAPDFKNPRHRTSSTLRKVHRSQLANTGQG